MGITKEALDGAYTPEQVGYQKGGLYALNEAIELLEEILPAEEP